MDENDPLSEQNKISLGHICTNGAIYYKINFKLRSALHFRYSKVIPRFIPHANTAQSHYNHGFHNTFDYNHFTNSDYNYCAQ